MLSDIPGSISLDSETINEILEGPIDPQTNNENVFFAATKYKDQLINGFVKETTLEMKKMTIKRSMSRDNWKKNKRKRAYQSGKAHPTEESRLKRKR